MYEMKPEDLKMFYYVDENNEMQQQPSLFFIITDIWNILSEELTKRGVNNIQCFLNMIMPELSKLIISNERSMLKEVERNDFEELCNQVIEHCITNYNNYYMVYTENNQKLLEITDDTIESILEETSKLENLSVKVYPLIKYFYATDYPKKKYI